MGVLLIKHNLLKEMKETDKLKLKWQKHNRDNGLTWNEVSQLVNEVNMLRDRDRFASGVKWLQERVHVPKRA